MHYQISEDYSSLKPQLKSIINNFENTGNVFINGERNTLKTFNLERITLNIKSFKKPNIINQFAYKYIRSSKAKRSFNFAKILLSKNIGTPKPIAYFEEFSTFGLQKSYYISEHLTYDLTYRELVEVPNYPDHENILRQFTQFCVKLHNNGIEFKDHSPGNTLIKSLKNNKYEFYLVDLNRMNFHKTMSLELRMKNLCRLTPKKEMVKIMASEYAKTTLESEQKLFNLLWNYTSKFQHKYHRKQKLKARFR